MSVNSRTTSTPETPTATGRRASRLDRRESPLDRRQPGRDRRQPRRPREYLRTVRRASGVHRLQGMLPTAVPSGFVGRQGDRQRLRNLVSDVSAGRGGSVLVEGEPGIGKSALLAAAFTDADALGCEVAWATAGELSQRFPLRVLLDCLGVTARAADTDPERAEIAAALRAPRGGGLFSDSDPVRAATERLLAFVERRATRTPLVLVIDDLQWADDASLAAWRRLAEMADQVPVLLAAAYRQVPQRALLDQLRSTVQARAGLVIALQPLDEVEVTELVTDL